MDKEKELVDLDESTGHQKEQEEDLPQPKGKKKKKTKEVKKPESIKVYINQSVKGMFNKGINTVTPQELKLLQGSNIGFEIR